jgi:DNA-binding transcriptional LysR family regulator
MLDRLSEMRAFQAVADAGGFTAAAAELRVSQSLVSRAVASLERRLGTTLLHRSTRRVSLTDEGVIFLQGCRRVLEDIDEVERSVTPGEQPVGVLRISASVLFGQDPIVSLLPEFMSRYPKLDVQLSLADRHVDLIEEKIDVAIRLGRLASSSLIARKIGEQRRLIVASPAYLAQRGQPRTPDDLLDHNCLLWDEEHDDLNRWPFEVSGAMRHIRVRGRLVVNNAQALLHLAIMGVGISRMSEHRARPLIRRGELVSLLEVSHRDEATPVHALYARTNIAKPRVRVFLDFLTEKFSPDSYKEVEPGSASARKRDRQATATRRL